MQSYALALTITFLALLLAAGAIASESDENAIGRLRRGLISMGELVSAKVALAAVVALRRLADQMEDAQVERALRDGWTWAQVAEALGVTRQAVHKKHARRLRDV